MFVITVLIANDLFVSFTENRAPYSKGQASQGKKKLHSSDDSEEYGRGYVPSFGGKEDPRMSLSNSWPHDSNGRFADAAKPRLLDPISGELISYCLEPCIVFQRVVTIENAHTLLYLELHVCIEVCDLMLNVK